MNLRRTPTNIACSIKTEAIRADDERILPTDRRTLTSRHVRSMLPSSARDTKMSARDASVSTTTLITIMAALNTDVVLSINTDKPTVAMNNSTLSNPQTWNARTLHFSRLDATRWSTVDPTTRSVNRATAFRWRNVSNHGFGVGLGVRRSARTRRGSRLTTEAEEGPTERGRRLVASVESSLERERECSWGRDARAHGSFHGF